MSCAFAGRSSGSAIFVDHATEYASSLYRGTHVDDGDRVVLGWVLIETLVWRMLVDVARVGGKHGSGVLFV